MVRLVDTLGPCVIGHTLKIDSAYPLDDSPYSFVSHKGLKGGLGSVNIYSESYFKCSLWGRKTTAQTSLTGLIHAWGRRQICFLTPVLSQRHTPDIFTYILAQYLACICLILGCRSYNLDGRLFPASIVKCWTIYKQTIDEKLGQITLSWCKETER